LDDIEYVEPNRVYKAAIFPATLEPRPYTSKGLKSIHSIERRLEKRGAVTQENVPSWGISRINHRNRDDLTSYTLDEKAGEGISVYIFDTGIVPNHPDFADRAAIAANFIDYEDAVDLAGHGGNSFGIAKNAKLLGVKILDKYGDGETIALLREQHGIPVFVSSGNEGDDACNYSPSSNPSAFTVGASTLNDFIPPFSGHGNCVGLYAPGTNITSTWLNGQIQTMDGTSMANPHVSGIAAVLMSKYNFESAHEVYDALKSIATTGVLSSNNGEDNQLLAYYDVDV
ncbi:subtilisin-like protein, partial [Backusella circina FSU 941]